MILYRTAIALRRRSVFAPCGPDYLGQAGDGSPAAAEGRVAVTVTEDGTLSPGARRLNKLSRGALGRAVESAAWEKLSPGEAISLAWPADDGPGMSAAVMAPA